MIIRLQNPVVPCCPHCRTELLGYHVFLRVIGVTPDFFEDRRELLLKSFMRP